METINKILLYI